MQSMRLSIAFGCFLGCFMAFLVVGNLPAHVTFWISPQLVDLEAEAIDDDSAVPSYLSVALQDSGPSSRSSLPPCLVLLRDRLDKRKRFFNVNETAEHIRRTRCCEAIVYVPTVTHSYEEERALLARTSVYITYGGGGSMNGIWLPNGAAVIIGEQCYDGICQKWEAGFWTNMPNLMSAHYAEPNATVANMTGYDLNFARLDGMLDEAFYSQGRPASSC
eukprot:TRINITY_DN4125_c0_g2_i2.p1 TRINITY_DN4125_c0_g2~~TRINITY_DN4125_c0_g2_i2.p1  ORF type:complete len:219 (+),score=49.03 TRINITY_DN4125_c0_g2_i2:140-796(+)